jgi:endonuclease-3
MAKLTKADRAAVIESLLDEYPDARCALDYDTKFHLLCAVVLSAQTTDVSVNKVTPALFADAPDAAAMAALPVETIEEHSHSIGMYHQKAKNLKNLSAMLVEKYGGEVPGDYDLLTELPGVGRKTANVVLSVGFGEQHIAVDTHVFRVSNRIGLVREKDVLATEEALMRTIPQDRWSHAHHLLIFHGRNCCTAKKPACKNCCLQGLCEQQL